MFYRIINKEGGSKKCYWLINGPINKSIIMSQQQQDPSPKFPPLNSLLLDANDNLYEKNLFKQATHQFYIPCSQFHESMASTNQQMGFHRQFDQFDSCQFLCDQFFQMPQQELFSIDDFSGSVFQSASEAMGKEQHSKIVRKAGRPKKCTDELTESENEYQIQEISEQSDKIKLNKNRKKRVMLKNKNVLHFLYIEIIRHLKAESYLRDFEIFEGFKSFGTRHQLLEIFNNETYRVLLAKMFESKHIMHRIMLCKMPLQKNRILYKRSIMMFIKSCVKRFFEPNFTQS